MPITRMCINFSSPANSTSVSRDGSGLNIFEELLKWDSSQKKALPLNTLRKEQALHYETMNQPRKNYKDYVVLL